jgi:alkylhydroperoxidase/carboxymuconolactone decarboxylase family protein YurZ
MSEHPLKIFKTLDPDFLKLVEDTNQFTFADGSLPKKFKLLIAMTLDASLGAVHGVKALAEAAIHAGARKEEIMEALRVAYYISGVGSVYAAAEALKGVF